jgi:hypothetical protein
MAQFITAPLAMVLVNPLQRNLLNQLGLGIIN